MISEDEWNRRKHEWLPSPADREYVQSLMHPVTELGKIANWVAPPPRGVNGQPFEFEYVRKN
jgi:benzoyl-CoA 2,3-dioxygenase component B